MDIVFNNSHLLLQGTAITLWVSLMSALLATVLGVFFSLIQVYAGFFGKTITEIYLYLIRGIPLLVLLFAMYYMLPYSGIDIDPLNGGIIVVAIYFGAFMTEVFRGALLAVPRGQIDAGKACGMYGFVLIFYVIVPQAIRIAAPPYISTCIMLVKGTSLVSIIGLWDLTLAGRQIVERTLAAFEIFSGVAAIYFLICMSLALYGRYLERRVSYVQ